MKIGILSDTDNADDLILKEVVKDLSERGAELFVHCGGIISRHVNPPLFGGKNVVCALTKSQKLNPLFEFPPAGWRFTRPGSAANRLVRIGGGLIAYAGHERSLDVLKDPGKLLRLSEDIAAVSRDAGYIFSGHTRHQFLVRNEKTVWINPGAVSSGCDGQEFAMADSETGEVIFTRLKRQKQIPPYTVALINDTAEASEKDPHFWKKAAAEFRKRDARTIIHCGDLRPEDAGRQEWKDFEVWYALSPEEERRARDSSWKLIPGRSPTVKVHGHLFYADYAADLDLFSHSEREAVYNALQLTKDFFVDFVVSGKGGRQLYSSSKEVNIINPGSASSGRCFATVCLPRCEVTFGSVPA